EVDTEVMELPHAFRTTLESIPGPVPYIAVSPAPLRLRPGRLAVGLVWRAGTWNPARSLSMHELGILGEVRQVDWHLLQRVLRDRNTAPHSAATQAPMTRSRRREESPGWTF